MPLQAILFDLDGTLLDTLEDVADATNLALRAMGFPEHPLEAFKYLIGDGVENLVSRTLPEDRRDAATMLACATRLKEEYGRRWSVKTRPYDGVAEMLDGLAARRVPMAVLSNKPEEFTGQCVARFLPRWRFEAIVGASGRRPRKPAPDGALEIAARLCLPPADFLYLGDTNTDMQTAVAAGMYPVGALWGFRTRDELLAHGARTLIERPMQLLDVLDARL